MMKVIDDLKMILRHASVNCITDAKTYTEQKARYNDVVAYVYALEQNDMSTRWIPCSERLPEETDYPEQRYRILASCSDGIVRNATIKSLRDPEEKHRSMGNEFTYVAWKPLPEPYKGE